MSAIAVTLALFLAAPASGSTASAALSAPIKTLETYVVTGTVPGPGLWRVSKGDHTLWILGTVSPVPKDVVWDAAEVDALVADADEVLAPGGTSVTLGAGGTFKLMLLAPSVLAAIKNPDGKKLDEVLPADIYRQWASLKQKYVGKNRKIERRRPVFASMDLHSHAVSRAGMTRAAVVWNRVAAIAEQHDVPVTETAYRFDLAIDRRKTKAGLKAFAPADHECMAQTLDTLEHDLEAMKRSANAWATGDLEVLRQLERDDLQPACRRVQDEAMGFMELQHLEQAAFDAWLAKAESALSRNRSTVAVVSIPALLRPDGLLASLRARGYAVVEPDAEIDETGSDADVDAVDRTERP